MWFYTESIESRSSIIAMNHSTMRVSIVMIQLATAVWRLFSKFLPVDIPNLVQDHRDISRFLIAPKILRRDGKNRFSVEMRFMTRLWWCSVIAKFVRRSVLGQHRCFTNIHCITWAKIIINTSWPKMFLSIFKSWK